MMDKSVTLAMAVVFSLVALVSANSICDSASCENPINVSVGKDFTISREANPGSTGFEWWTNFDTYYLSLVNSTFTPRNASSKMVGGSGMEIFTFNAKRAGNTKVNMLLLRPWVNGTISRSNVLQVNIEQLSNNRPTYDIQQYSRVKPPYYTVPLTTSV
jgi:predicted secreted protein